MGREQGGCELFKTEKRQDIGLVRSDEARGPLGKLDQLGGDGSFPDLSCRSDKALHNGSINGGWAFRVDSQPDSGRSRVEHQGIRIELAVQRTFTVDTAELSLRIEKGAPEPGSPGNWNHLAPGGGRCGPESDPFLQMGGCP